MFKRKIYMKSVLFGMLTSLIFSTMANANSAVLGLGLDSCAKVIENVERDEDLAAAFKAAYTSYIMGFFSGVNVVYEDNVGLEEVEQLYLNAVSNCKAAPDASFVAAIINLYAEFKNK